MFQCAASVFRFLRIVFLKAKVIGKKILVFGNEQWVAVDIAYNIVRNGSLWSNVVFEKEVIFH